MKIFFIAYEKNTLLLRILQRTYIKKRKKKKRNKWKKSNKKSTKLIFYSND